MHVTGRVIVNSDTYDVALRLLGFRARTVSELRHKLQQKGESAADVEEILERLCEQKLLDDVDFARQYARSKLAGAGASRRRITQELARKGVTREIAEGALDDLVEDGLDPSASIHRIAAKKWRSLHGLDDFTRRRRLYAFLARRGFNPDEIRSAMNAVGQELDV